MYKIVWFSFLLAGCSLYESTARKALEDGSVNKYIGVNAYAADPEACTPVNSANVGMLDHVDWDLFTLQYDDTSATYSICPIRP